MNIVEMYDAIKSIALGVKMINEVHLLKANDNIDELLKKMRYRSMIVVASNGDIEKDDNSFTFSVSIIDKTTEDDSLYLQSINDGMTALRLIADGLNYNHNQRITYSNIVTGSGYDNGLITTLNCDARFEFETVNRGLNV